MDHTLCGDFITWVAVPVVVLVEVLNGQEGVGEDVDEGHPDGRAQPAVSSFVNQGNTL